MAMYLKTPQPRIFSLDQAPKLYKPPCERFPYRLHIDTTRLNARRISRDTQETIDAPHPQSEQSAPEFLLRLYNAAP